MPKCQKMENGDIREGVKSYIYGRHKNFFQLRKKINLCATVSWVSALCSLCVSFRSFAAASLPTCSTFNLATCPVLSIPRDRVDCSVLEYQQLDSDLTVSHDDLCTFFCTLPTPLKSGVSAVCVWEGGGLI
jgi:hypothetical protein